MDRKALFIVLTDHPGGAERVAFALAAELAARPGWRVEVTIACAMAPDSFSRAALPPSVRVDYGPFRSPFLGFASLPFRLLARPYDLLFTTHVYTNALVSAMRRLGLVRTRRLVMRESMALFDRFAGLKARLFKALYRWYGGEDLLIAQTDYMADHVRPWLPPRSAARLRAMPNPVDVRAIERGIAEGLDPALRDCLAARPAILFCGRFVQFKRPDLALEAFGLLQSRRPGVQLVFMGAGPLEARLREAAERSGLADSVLFLGQRANPYPVMSACRYGLVTSDNEGFPNVLLEMMACGMDGIVTTPCADGLGRLAGVKVTATHEPGELAEALASALQSSGSCGERFQASVADRSAAAYVDRLIAAASH